MSRLKPSLRNTPRRRWQYRFQNIEVASYDELETALTRLGQAGWNLVSLFKKNSSSFAAVVRRPTL